MCICEFLHPSCICSSGFWRRLWRCPCLHHSPESGTKWEWFVFKAPLSGRALCTFVAYGPFALHRKPELWFFSPLFAKIPPHLCTGYSLQGKAHSAPLYQELVHSEGLVLASWCRAETVWRRSCVVEGSGPKGCEPSGRKVKLVPITGHQ